jgi:hypothetical protein
VCEEGGHRVTVHHPRRCLSAMDADEIDRRLLDDKAGELEHELFATVTSKLSASKQREFERRNFEIQDPNSEIYLEHADADPELIRMMEQKALCVDAYTNLDGIAGTPTGRQKQLKKQLQAAKQDAEPTFAYKRPVCKDENYEVFQGFGLDKADAQSCVYALSFYTGAGSNSTSRGASLFNKCRATTSVG